MRFIFSTALLVFAGACASLTEEQCLNADWRAIGYDDGVNGRLETYISRHFDACSRVGVTPDVQAWQEGRAAGLPLYCTPGNAYSVGRSGSELSPVCPASQQNRLFYAWDWGHEYYLIGGQIAALETEERDIRRRLLEIGTPATPEDVQLVASLNERLRWIGDEISRLKARRQRYASAPI